MIVTADRLSWLLVARAALAWPAEARAALADHLEFHTGDEALGGVADVLRVVKPDVVRPPLERARA